jgi:small conductance mechanosensitive channel
MSNPITKTAAAFDPRALLSAGLAAKAIDFAAALLIVLVGWWLARWISRLLDRSLLKMEADEILRSFLRNIAFAALMVVVVIAALQKVGVPTTSLLAMLGAAGLGIGLALKDSLSNIASGLMLIVQRPFKAGDAVQVGGVEGVVEQVRIFTTRMRTYQNEWIVPATYCLRSPRPIPRSCANPPPRSW